MTREIKFRAWVGGKRGFMEQFEDIIAGGQNDDWITYLPDVFKDKNRHFMQFTGLKDKNGKEIYEGDIVICRTDKDYQRYASEVVIEPMIGFGTRLGDGSWNGLLSTWLSHGCEVIGNIYENPSLLP